MKLKTNSILLVAGLGLLNCSSLRAEYLTPALMKKISVGAPKTALALHNHKTAQAGERVERILKDNPQSILPLVTDQTTSSVKNNFVAWAELAMPPSENDSFGPTLKKATKVTVNGLVIPHDEEKQIPIRGQSFDINITPTQETMNLLTTLKASAQVGVNKYIVMPLAYTFHKLHDWGIFDGFHWKYVTQTKQPTYFVADMVAAQPVLEKAMEAANKLQENPNLSTWQLVRQLASHITLRVKFPTWLPRIGLHLPEAQD